MVGNYFLRIALCLLVTELSVLSAEIIILKKSSVGNADYAPLDNADQVYYQNNIFNIIDRYQWPTSLLPC